ncbi:MAG: phosphoribosylformylglycinamidine cyclo-ligase [Calditrichaeota bacterium]|nr:MAG: phosphoribosylformylglycinamidine cyclo-ligase [Calditrichota bacterium]
MTENNKNSKITYAASGVDVKAGEDAVNRIKSLAASTFNAQVLTGLGSFGGFFKPELADYKEPVLLSSTDSVGTKLKVAFMTDKHTTIGQCLVNHCINDILVHGAKSMFFLDYIGVGKLKQDTIADIVEGVTIACKENETALVGGEMAELPDFYAPGEYDLVGFVVGMVDKDKIVNGSTIKEGDVCLGLPSTGLHTNGYTLARKVAFDIGGLKPDTYVEELGTTIGDALLAVHKCYAPLIHNLLDSHTINGMAHITGGGIPGNLKRILPENLSAEINKSSWDAVPIFDYLKILGDIDLVDIYSAFNMGIGYILVVDEKDADAISASIRQFGEKVYRIGFITKGDGTVKLV